MLRREIRCLYCCIRLLRGLSIMFKNKSASTIAHQFPAFILEITIMKKYM